MRKPQLGVEVARQDNFRNCRPFQLQSLLQLRVLGFGLFQDGDVGVGVLPEGEEISVGAEGACASEVAVGGGDFA